jgi:hypothetical protein
MRPLLSNKGIEVGHVKSLSQSEGKTWIVMHGIAPKPADTQAISPCGLSGMTLCSSESLDASDGVKPNGVR